MMEAQTQGHVDVCPSLRVKLGGIFPFKQKLDVDLNVQSDNPQQIGKHVLLLQEIWVHILDTCEIKHTGSSRHYLSEPNFDVRFKQ